MRRTYNTTDGNKIRKLGRAKKIYFNNAGNPYFLWNGRRESFDNIPRLTYPVMYEDEAGKVGAIGGYICISNFGGVLVEVDEYCESVQLWEEVEN